MIKSAFLPIIHSDSEILILGTFPSVKSLEKTEYYGNKQNQFWKLIYAIFEESFQNDYSDRLFLLKKNKIALWDVLESCEREGSLDDKIKNIKINNFEALFNKYQNIKLIAFSSKNAYNYYKKHINDFYDKEYIILPSSSGIYAQMNFESKLEIWKKILQKKSNL